MTAAITSQLAGAAVCPHGRGHTVCGGCRSGRGGQADQSRQREAEEEEEEAQVKVVRPEPGAGPPMRKSERPVSSMLRLGQHTAGCVPPMMNALRKTVPRRTRPSRWGVRKSGRPSAPIVSARWSSVRMSRMFGRRRAVMSKNPRAGGTSNYRHDTYPIKLTAVNHLTKTTANQSIPTNTPIMMMHTRATTSNCHANSRNGIIDVG